MQLKRIIHYFISILVSVVAFFIVFVGLCHFFEVQNVLGGGKEFVKAILIIVIASILGGLVYSVAFNRGNCVFAIIPAALIGSIFLGAEIYDSTRAVDPSRRFRWMFILPGLIGIAVSYVSAKFARLILAKHSAQ